MQKTILILMTLFISAASAQVQFTASVARHGGGGANVTVIATLVAPQAVQGVPHLEANEYFDVVGTTTSSGQSRNVQIIGGNVQHTVEYTYRYIYTIAPKTTEPFIFPALTANVGGNTYSSNPVRIGGSGASGGSGGATQGGGAAQGGGGNVTASEQRSSDLRVSLSASKRRLYVGEQAVLTLKVMQRANTPINTNRGYAGAIEQIESAFAREFSLNRLFTNNITQGQEQIDGVLYHTFILRYALFPIRAGEFTIPSIRFDYDEVHRTARRQSSFFFDIFDMDVFGGTQNVRRSARSNPFTINVLPLPSSPPHGFVGSVGRFSLNATVDQTSVSAGDPLTLTVTLRGNTRASNIGDPLMPEISGADVFPPERQTVVDTGDAGFSTRKTYRYLIVPREEGQLTIAPIKYPFLNPETGRFQTIETAPITIAVAPGTNVQTPQTRILTQEEIRQVGHDIRYIKTPQTLARQNNMPHRAPHWYILFPLPFLIFLFALAYKLQSKNSGVLAIKNIRQKALANAVRDLNKANKTSATDNEFLGKASNIIEKYISRKLAFPATGRTLEELKDELLSRKIDEETVNGLAALIENINEHRFGGKPFDAQTKDNIIEQTINFLSSMERIVKKEKPRTNTLQTGALIIFLPMFLTMFATPAHAAKPSADINAIFATANGFYAESEFDSALVYYTKILDAGVKNSALFFNVGNTHYRLRNAGLARLYYEKALVLSPRDADIIANIDFIKTVIVDREEVVADDDFLTAVMYGIHTLLTLDAQLVILCALLFALAFIGCLILFKRGLARLWLAYGAVFFALIIIVVGSSAVYKIYALETRQYAIVMTQSLDAQNQPAGTQTLFTVHEGTKLRVTQTQGDYSLVSLQNGASGWVRSSGIAKIF